MSRPVSIKAVFIIFCIVLVGCGVVIVAKDYALDLWNLRDWLWYLAGVGLGIVITVWQLVHNKLIRWDDKLK